MAHNFPKGVTVIYKTKHNLKQIKEIMHLCIDNGLFISGSTLARPLRKDYPYMGISNDTLYLYSSISNISNYYVLFDEFKAFCIGKGNQPYSKTLKLNSRYDAVITKDKIRVGCQDFSHDIIKKLYDESQKALKSK